MKPGWDPVAADLKARLERIEQALERSGRGDARRDEVLYGSALLAARAAGYRRLLAEALPFARVELAWMKGRQHVADERGMVRNIQAAFAAIAMIRGETIEQTIARLWGALAEAKRAA